MQISHYYYLLISILPGLAAWIIYVKKQEPPVKRLLAYAFFCGLGLRLWMAGMVPPFEAPDERAHWAYVCYLSEHHSLPVQTETEGPLNQEYEYHQPLLYYLFLAFLCKGLGVLGVSGEGLFYSARFLTVGLWAFGAWFLYRFLEESDFLNPFLSLTAFLMYTLLPSYVFLSAMITNDNFLAFWGVVILYLLKRSNQKPLRLLGLGFCLGFAFLTKISAVFLVMMSVFYLLAEAFARRSLKRAFWESAIVLLPFLILALPHMIRNYLVYANITGLNVAMNPLALTGENSFMGALSSIQSSFWATAGRYNEISFYYPAPGVIFSYLALGGLARDFFGRRKPLIPLLQHPLGSAFTLSFLLLLTVDFFYGYFLQEGQGRFLFHFLVPAALLFASGLQNFLEPRQESSRTFLHWTFFFITYASSFAIYVAMVL